MEPDSPNPLPSDVPPPEVPAPDPAAIPPLEPASPTPAGPSLTRGLARFLYTNNPLYVVSAALVMFGLHRSFEGPALGQHPWLLLSILGGYLLLLSVTAFGVVRFGRVWEDGRMIILLVLVLLLGLSVAFDGVLARDRPTGLALLFAGLALSVAISEGLLWGLSVRFPAGYRGPFYLLLAIFFLYPWGMAEANHGYGGDAAGWGAYLFPVSMGAAFLTLLPAVRRGPDYIPRSTPWGWPWFPWTLFAVLVAGAGVRSWYLTISFVPGLGLESTFGWYFLAPLGFAGAVLLLERGIAARRAVVQQAALATSAAVVWLSRGSLARGADYREFLERLTATVASPLYLALIASLVLCLIAWARGVRVRGWLVLALAAAVYTRPDRVDFDVSGSPVVWPLWCLAAMAVHEAWRTPSAVRELAAAAACLGALAAGQWESPWMAWHGLLYWQALLAAAVWISARYDDFTARVLRSMSGACLGLFAILVAVLQGPFRDRPWAMCGYLLCLALAAGLVAWRSASGVHLVSTTLALAGAATGPLDAFRKFLEGTVVARGFDLLAAGLAFFLLAALVSLEKAGVVRRAWGWCRQRREAVKRARTPG